MERNSSEVYDGNLRRAVQLFQLRHGLAPDGIAGPATFSEIAKTAQERLASVLVALERENGLILILGHDMSSLIYQISQRSCLRMAPLFLKQETSLGRL